MVTIVNVDPSGNAREIADTGQIVAHGESVEVDAELAGRAPTPAKGAPGEEGYVPGDPGEGLLAQTEVWQKPTTKAARAAKEDG